MKPNARALASRDPALAAIMGAYGRTGADFGDDYGAEIDPHMGRDVAYGEIDGEFDGEFDGDFGAGPTPTPTAAIALWKQARAARARGRRRVGLLEPNMGSRAKIERYSFALPVQTIVVNGVAAPYSTSGTPKVDFRPQRLLLNPPTRGFLLITTTEVSNVNSQVGTGSFDAAFFVENAQGVMMDWPKLSPAQPATITGLYTGLIPAGFSTSPPANYPLTATLIGPATMAGGSC
jgi:hypothetical protein